MIYDVGETIAALLMLGVGLFFGLGLPILTLIAFFHARSLDRQLVQLRREVEALRVRPVTGAEKAPETTVPPVIAERPREPAQVPTEEEEPQALEATRTPAPPPPVPEPAKAAARIQDSDEEPRPAGLEQRLGARGFVWIGGLSMALAGAFLVKYSIDEGLLTEGLRVVLGLILGVALLVAGDRLRGQSRTIGQALTAAGVADLYASLYAAVALYHLISPAFAFVVLCGVTAIAIGLALRHGPFVGLVGLAGGFLTPYIVSTGDPRPAVLFTFLYVLQLGAHWLNRVRGWWYLAAIGIAGGLAWVGLLMVSTEVTRDGTLLGQVWLPLFLIATALTSIWLCPPPMDRRWPPSRIVAVASVALCSLLIINWLDQVAYATQDWLFVLLLAGASMLAARYRPHIDVAVYVVVGIVLFGFLAWYPRFSALANWPETAELDRYLWISLALGTLLTGGGFALNWGAEKPARWSAISTVGNAIVFAIVYERLRWTEFLLPWSILCALMSALHLGAAERLNKWRLAEIRYRGAFALHVLASAGFLAAAIPLVVEKEWLAVAWSLLLPMTAWLAARLDEPWLRRSIWVGAPAVLLAVIFSGFPAGSTPIFNWLLYGIGVPTVAFIVTARIVRLSGDQVLGLALALGGALLAFCLVSLEIRHLFHGEAFRTAKLTFAEAGTLVLLWGGMAWVVLEVAQRQGLPKLKNAGYILTALGALMTVYGVWGIANPLLHDMPVAGSPIFNTLLYVFGGNLLLFAFLAKRLYHEEPEGSAGRNFAYLLGIFALLDGFIGVSALNRHLFQGEIISFGRAEMMSDAELYGYSVAWLLYAGALIGIALRANMQLLRHAGAGVALVAVLKVFIVDASDLTGLYRVASFLALGTVLIGFGYLYQRFVLKRTS